MERYVHTYVLRICGAECVVCAGIAGLMEYVLCVCVRCPFIHVFAY